MSNKTYLKSLGARIFSEANDLKRTIKALAEDLNFEEEYVNEIIEGKRTLEEVKSLIFKMGEIYPIDSSDLLLLNDDTNEDILIFDAKTSLQTSRVFNRLDKTGEKTPFYEYRDTVISRVAPFKPEWIRELRVVENSDPYNEDVAFNNGHFMHQLTFFIGEVNFYWQIDGKKYCKEMNTGDSNYITPYIPHTFASRNKNKKGLILAVTFGGNARRAQKELYSLGLKAVEGYKLDIKDENKAVSQLIKFHMKDENITNDILKELIKAQNLPIKLKDLLDESKEKSLRDLNYIASILNIEATDLQVPKYIKEHEVAISKKDKKVFSFYPNKKKKNYKIYNLARANKMPSLKAFNIHVIKKDIEKEDFFSSSLHSYLYNYGKNTVKLLWEYEGQIKEKEIISGDSIYIKPFTKYAFVKLEKKAKILNVRVGGAVNFCTQKELSYFADIKRMTNENKSWF